MGQDAQERPRIRVHHAGARIRTERQHTVGFGHQETDVGTGGRVQRRNPRI